LKIVYDHQIFGWQAYGGVSRYFLELALAMNKMANVNVCIVSQIFVNRYLSESVDKVKVFGYSFPVIPKAGRFIRLFNNLFTKLYLYFLKPDILHETYYSRVNLAPKSTMVVITVHDMIHELFKKDINFFDQTSLDKLAAVRRANHIICVSENTKNDLIKLFDVEPNKVSVVYHGLSKGFQHVKESPVFNSGNYLLYVGSRFGYKNFDNFLRAFVITKSHFKDLKIVCFGGGKFSLKEQQLFLDLGISSDDLTYLKGSDATLANLYTHAKLLVYPSLYEGFGIPPLEAMSCGCPVICSNTSSIPEVVGAAGLYFDPQSPPDIAKTILEVLEDSGRRSKLISHGYERIKQFSWERCARETYAIYQNVLTSQK
jgi:glycosyltransferase involved in cell wall biosynthesis